MFFNKKLPATYLFLSGCLAWILFTSNSGGSPGDYSGWQSPPQTCANCHFGGLETGSVMLSGAPSTYVFGQTYDMTLTITDPDANFGGFIISAINPMNGYVGSFIANATMGVKVVGGYSTHNAKKAISGGTVSWPIKWKAPTTGNSLVKFYWVGNAVDGGGTSGDSVYPDNSPSFVALPLELTAFSVEKTRSEMLLKWRTSSEKNTAFFKILRSENGVNFNEIGKVTALNDFSKDNNYSFSDLASTENSHIFYKLEIIDFDGKSNFSPIKSVKNLDNFSTKIYPTFFEKNQLTTLFIEQKMEVSEAQIFDVSGKFHTRFPLEKGQNQLEIQLDSGIYFVKIGAITTRILVN